MNYCWCLVWYVFSVGVKVRICLCSSVVVVRGVFLINEETL